MNSDIITIVTFAPVAIPFVLYTLPFRKTGWHRTFFRYIIVTLFALGGAAFYYYLFISTTLTPWAIGVRALVYYTVLEVVRRILPGVRRRRRRASKKAKSSVRRVLFSVLALTLVIVIARDFLIEIGVPLSNLTAFLP